MATHKSRKQYKTIHGFTKKPVVKGKSEEVLIKGKSGETKPGVRRYSPGQSEGGVGGFTYQEKRDQEIKIRLSEREWTAIAEYLSRSQDPPALGPFVMSTVFTFIKENPPLKTPNRTLLRLRDNRQLTILYKRGTKLDVGHIHMLDLDPETERRSSPLREGGAVKIKYSQKVLIQEFCYEHQISMQALYHLSVIDYLYKYSKDLPFPTWHKSHFLDDWVGAQVIRKNAHRLKHSRENG